MKEKILNFDVPEYIMDEIKEYTKDVENGKCKCMKWENIKALIGLAVLNNTITKEQGDFIRKQFYIED